MSDVNCVFLRGVVKSVGKDCESYTVFYVRTETEPEGRYQVHTVIDKRKGPRKLYDQGEAFPLTFGRARYFQDRCTILVDDETDREGLELIASLTPSPTHPVARSCEKEERTSRKPRSYTREPPPREHRQGA